MKKEVMKFSVDYLQILDENGKCDEKLKPRIGNNNLKKIYENMILTRAFDNKALKLQRQGRLGTYAPMRGQEACQIASGFAMRKEDWIFPAFRENGLYIMKGVPAKMLYHYWAGDERGMQIPEGVQMFPISITVGAHLPHAVGAAMAFNIKKEKKVAITYFGDGATSEGDFHTAMNFAGTFNAPCVFICQNNQWAISVPVKEQTASKTLAQKAIGYGFEGIQVDGNDVFAVYKATENALKKARAGKGPTLIECFTYRLADHTTSDDAKKYRKESEVRKWEKKDPILRFEKYLLKKKVGNSDYFESVRKKAETEIEKAVQEFESISPYKPEEIFNYMYAEKTPDLIEQQAFFLKELKTMPKKIKKLSEVKKRGEKGAGVVGELEEAPVKKKTMGKKATKIIKKKVLGGK